MGGHDKQEGHGCLVSHNSTHNTLAYFPNFSFVTVMALGLDLLFCWDDCVNGLIKLYTPVVHDTGGIRDLCLSLYDHCTHSGAEEVC